MCRFQYSNLCRLLHDSLHLLTVKVKSTVLITKEHEKLLLITLSQVLNKTKLWTAELDSNSGSGSDSDNENNVINDLHDHSSASHCILKITNQLVLLLAVESEFIQHLAANVAVSVSEFVMASGSYWEEFMQSLCCYFELILCKVLSPSSDRPFRAETPGFDSADLTLDLQCVLDNATWHSAGAIVSVLRTILKQLKDEDDVEILEIYFQVVGSCLEVIPWDACNIILVDDINNSRAQFCGYLVQLFCSLADCEDENRAVRIIFNIFPKTLTWFFGGQEESNNNTCISRYIRHKFLVLMIRLSYLVKLDCETVVSWLHITEKYFQDLLSEPVIESESDQDDCLKDSPFNGSSYRHLQRRVIFLYLRCAFSLIGLKDKCEKRCSCGNMNSCSKIGFIAVYAWVKKHLPANILDNHELYDECCKSFTKSFIRLYMHEDDMLFKILLQLTYTQTITEDRMPEVVAKDIVFLLSYIFDPVCLFHLFLSELHYDHQVLLDYLISKDTGASCAEYLLRCLRIICDKWNSFLKFPFWVEVERQPLHKRRKIENDKACEHAFSNARDCLLLLKKSLESLHQKDLFPYNPQVLLRRLTRFQELCLNRV